MTEDGTFPESQRASTGCCGCIGGHWLRKRPVLTSKSGIAAEAEATQNWETVSPGFTLVVPPSSPVSEESSAVQSSVPTPTHRSTSPLDDENLDLGFFTRQHKASFSDNGAGISSTLSTNAVTPPSSSPSGAADDLWPALGESSSYDLPIAAKDVVPLFHSQVWPADLQDQEPAVVEPEGTSWQPSPSSTPHELGSRDDKESCVPRLASPAQFLQVQISRHETEGAEEAGAKVVEAATAEPHAAVPFLLASPEQFRLQQAKQKQLAESLKAKHDEDAAVEAAARHHRVPTLPSPQEFLSQKDRQQAAQMEALRAARLTEPKVVIPKLPPPPPPSRSSQEEEEKEEELASVNLDPRPKRSQEGQGREDNEACNGEHDDDDNESPRYVELVSRIEQLALDLETAQSRGQKCKLLLEWSQLRANTLEEGVAGLSEELTQQQSAYLDLQAKHFAHFGISLPSSSASFSG